MIERGSCLIRRDAFSHCHPAVNFIFFLCAIGFGVVIQHPAYLIAGCTAGSIYYLMLRGKKGAKFLLAMIPLWILIAILNPIINSSGSHILFRFFGRPYTLEALFYGMAIGGLFFCMMVTSMRELSLQVKFEKLVGTQLEKLARNSRTSFIYRR